MGVVFGVTDGFLVVVGSGFDVVVGSGTGVVVRFGVGVVLFGTGVVLFGGVLKAAKEEDEIFDWRAAAFFPPAGESGSDVNDNAEFEALGDDVVDDTGGIVSVLGCEVPVYADVTVLDRLFVVAGAAEEPGDVTWVAEPVPGVADPDGTNSVSGILPEEAEADGRNDMDELPVAAGIESKPVEPPSDPLALVIMG